MTRDELLLANHQLGMYVAYRDIGTHEGLARWRAHNRAAAELREQVGAIYQVYPYPNKALVKALYGSLQEHLISRADFAACIQCVMGKHYVHSSEQPSA